MRRESSIGMFLSFAFRSVLSVPLLVLLVALALSQTKPTVAFSSTPASRWGASSTTVTTTAGRAAVGRPAVMHRVSSCRSPFGWPATLSNTVPLQQQSPCTVTLWDTSGEGDDTTAPLSNANNDDANDNEAAVTASTPSLTIRQHLRKATGFSFTALRTTLRKITGFSLTALRASLRAATGISLTALRISAFASTSAAVRNTMKFILSPFPDWSRYFVQPFMVAYYVPLVMIKVQPTEAAMKERNARSEAFDDEMRNVVQTAYDDHAAMEDKDSYWPVRVNEEGEIEAVGRPGQDASTVDVTSAVSDSFDYVFGKAEAS